MPMLSAHNGAFRGVTRAALLLAGASVLVAPGLAAAAGTRAGTLINNTASATYDQGGPPSTVNSNVQQLRVDELIDITTVWSDSADVPTTPNATGQVLKFTLTNIGNGAEAFGLTTVSTIGGDNYDPTVNQIVIDNGNGIYEPGIDVVYVPGSNDPVLQPDASAVVFVVATTPGTVSDNDRGGIQLVGTSRTGTGAPGSSVLGAGEGGGDAVFGPSGGDDDDNGYYQVASATIGLVKSATVLDPFGGSEVVPGSIITYTIVATTSGSGSLANVAINDSVPATTTYVTNSITLGGAPLTDAADADAGRFSANAIAVSLGTVAGGQTRTVTFRTRVN
jgi:uncharacterized repeat protein (TIGR01451 family)